jgi:hypothetical protein
MFARGDAKVIIVRMTAGKPLSPSPLTPAATAVCIAWAVVVAIGGGLLIGWLLTTRNGLFGNIGFMVLGFVAGWVARKFNGRGVPWVGVALAVSIIVSFVIAEIAWLHWAGIDGAETWAGAARLALTLPDIGTGVFLLGLLCALFGAYSAWWWGGSRWKLFIVPDE